VRACRRGCYTLGEFDRADGGLAVAGIVSRVESHLLTLAQASNAGALQCGGVDEHVLLAIIRLDKAEAFLVIVELKNLTVPVFMENSFSPTVCTWDLAHESSCPLSRLIDFGEKV
jgi:hypothetical protein